MAIQIYFLLIITNSFILLDPIMLKQSTLSLDTQASFINPQDECQTLLEKAHKKFLKLQINQAIDLYRQHINQNIETVDPYFEGHGNHDSYLGRYKKSFIVEFLERKREKINDGLMSPYDCLSMCFLSNKNYFRDAEKWYLEMIEKSKTNWMLLFGIANLYYNHRKQCQAYQFYDKVEILKKDCVDVYEMKAFIHQRFIIYGQKEQVQIHKKFIKQLTEKVFKIKKESQHSQLLWVITVEDKEQKLVCLEKLLLKYPSNTRIHTLIAQTNSNLKDKRKAEVFYEKGLKINTYNLKLYYGLGKIATENKNYRIAKKNYLKALNLIEEYVHQQFKEVIFLKLSKVSFLLKDFEQSWQYLKKADKIGVIKFKPVTFQIMSRRVILHIQKKDIREAKNLLCDALKFNPQKHALSYIYLTLGKIYCKRTEIETDQKKSLKMALEYFEKATEADQNSFEAYYFLGLYLEKHDKNEKSLQIFKKALEIDPESTKTRINIGKYYLQKHNYIQAYKILGIVPATIKKRLQWKNKIKRVLLCNKHNQRLKIKKVTLDEKKQQVTKVFEKMFLEESLQ